MNENTQKPIIVNRTNPAFRPPGNADSAANALTPKDVIGILRRHIWMMIIFTFLGIIIGGAAWYLVMKYAPKYTAMTYIKVLPPAEKDPTQIGSGQLNKDIQYGYRSSLASLIKQQNKLQELISRDEVQKTKWFENFGDIKEKRITKAVKDLKKHLGVSAQRDGEFIIISMTCGKAEESALIVNEMVDLFVKSQEVTKKSEVTAKLAGLRSEKENVQAELMFADKMLDDIRKASDFSDLDEHSFQDAITLKLSRLELDQSDLTQQIRQIQSSVKILERQAASPIDEQIENEIERDPTMIMLTQQLATQEASLAGRLARFGENHRVVQQLKEQIKETRARKLQRKNDIAAQTRQANLINAQNQLIILVENLESLERLRQETMAKKEDLDVAKVRYERQMTIRDEIKIRLDSINEQVQKRLIMEKDPDTPKVQKVGAAPVPLEVSSPLWYVYFPGGMFLGFMMGIGLAFLIELANDLVRTPRDIGRYLHIPLLGVIPHSEEDSKLRGVDLYDVVRQSPYSIISESYRRFRTNLKLSNPEGSSHVLLIASGMSRDGITSVASNLGASLAAEQNKVLLIDANFWHPNIHKIYFGGKGKKGDKELASEFGLSRLLKGDCGDEQAIMSTEIRGLDIIDSGQLPVDPAELLGGPRMQELIERQKQNYDYVIIDGPPVLMVSDVKSLAKYVDATVLVFNANATHRGAAIRTIREFKEVNAEIIGCVLFAVHAMKGGYFNEQYKSYKKYQKAQLARSS